MEKNCSNCTKRNDCSLIESCRSAGNKYCRFYNDLHLVEVKPDKFKEFEKAVRPLMKWVAENYDPHTKIIIAYDKAELIQEKMGVITDDYVQD